MIVSHTAFMWFCSALIGGVSVIWLVVDVVRLRRALPYTPATHDRVFGSVIGIVVALAGIAGVLRYHL